MKKKYYYRTHPIWQFGRMVLYLLLAILLSGWTIWVVALGKGIARNSLNSLEVFFAIVVQVILSGIIYIFIRWYIRWEKNHGICFDLDNIYVNDEDKRMPPLISIQYYAEARYEDIEFIDIEWIYADSKGGPLELSGLTADDKLVYLVVRTKENTVRFYVSVFLPNSIIKIVDELRQRMAFCWK